MKIYRAVTLLVLILCGLLLVGVMTAYGIATFSGGSLIALVVVVVAALIAGIAFSWRRYSSSTRARTRARASGDD
jgi:hypothetical protein